MIVIVLLVVLCVVSFHRYSAGLNFTKSSDTSSQTDNSTSKNNNILTNTDWRDIAPQILYYNKTQPSKWTKIIQCCNCDKTLQLKEFNKHYIHSYNQAKTIKYGPNMRSSVATNDVWSIFTWNERQSTKQGQRESNQIHTRILVSFWSSNKPNYQY